MILKPTQPSLAKHLEQYLKYDVKFRKVYKATKRDFEKINLGAHNFEHIYRDVCNAIVIGEAEKADMRIVLPAIALHDIGFLYGASGKNHCEVGAAKLPNYLQKIKVSYPTHVVRHISACIVTHKGSMFELKPTTLEAKVVCDADLLEKFGPFGVYQTIRTWVEFGKGIESTIIKLRRDNIPYLSMETKTGNKLIPPRARQYVKDFANALDRAYEPYR